MLRKWKIVLLGVFLILITLLSLLLFIYEIYFPPYSYTYSETTGSLTVEHIFKEEEKFVLSKQENSTLSSKVILEMVMGRNFMGLLFLISILLLQTLLLLYSTLRNSRYFKTAMYIYGGVFIIFLGAMTIEFIENYQSFALLLGELQNMEVD